MTELIPSSEKKFKTFEAGRAYLQVGEIHNVIVMYSEKN